MSVEKVPHLAANGASNTKSVGGIKGDRGAQSSADGSKVVGGFGALLSSLGVKDEEPNAATGVTSLGPVDPSVVDVSNGGTSFGVFTPTVQSPLIPPHGESVDDLVSSGVKDIQTQVGGALMSDSGGVMAVDARPVGGLAGGRHAPGVTEQARLSEMPDELGLSNSATRAVRLQKERGRVESAPLVAAFSISAAIAVDPGKLELRVLGERADMLGAALAKAASEVLPLETNPQAEFRRETAIFKANSTTAGLDLGLPGSFDARPTSLSLESMAPDVGAGMTQGDQNPGTYWMSGDMKNAEMKLDGFGDSPVEVSIRVHGNQTHVAFRTDEIQTRLALEDAGATLKDMLNKEGLDLTGVSVGTSASGGHGSQDRRPRPDNRLALSDQLTHKFPAGSSGHIAAMRVGKLDVFV